jgi:hypothetical protein
MPAPNRGWLLMASVAETTALQRRRRTSTRRSTLCVGTHRCDRRRSGFAPRARARHAPGLPSALTPAGTMARARIRMFCTELGYGSRFSITMDRVQLAVAVLLFVVLWYLGR